MNYIDFDRVVRVGKNGEYVAKNRYYRDILKAVETDVVLAFESAAEYLEMTSGDFGVDVHVYSLCELPSPFVVHLVERFDEIDFVETDGVKVATFNQTINDLLASEDVDEQIVLETLGSYYYENGKSFEGLCIYENNLQRFNEEKQAAIEYWTE